MIRDGRALNRAITVLSGKTLGKVGKQVFCSDLLPTLKDISAGTALNFFTAMKFSWRFSCSSG